MSTIYALSTPEGRSAIAVFRVSGPKSINILTSLAGEVEYTPRHAYFKTLTLGEQLIDKALVFYFKAPHSFTGEDAVEFHLHGSPALLRVFPKVLSKLGAVPAEPGEFTKRAFYNDALDLTEVEGLAHLIQAETEAQHKVAIRQADGYAKKTFTKWRDILLAQLAYIEADIDFVEGEIEESFLDSVKLSIEKLTSEVNSFRDQHQNIKSLAEGLRVALVGAPNVGKSTLYNLILGREAALVSHEAGTTRDILETKIDFEGYPILLADMAGIRDADQSLEARGIEKAKAWQEYADIKVYIYAHDQPLPKSYPDDADTILINKADLVDEKSTHSVEFHKPEDFQKVRALLKEAILKKQPEASAHFYMAGSHESILKALLFSLERIRSQSEIELVAADLRNAVLQIGKLTGHIDVEEVLGKIFSSFCIGK